MKALLSFLTVLSLAASAQTPQVPHKLRFAGITLTIRDDARQEIQKDVDALTRSPRHYHEKADRARMYFPIIEQVFREENLPEDFKYLVLQESALVADAVSVSNAVGFWQFKDFTAIEMGLRVDKVVDERMNIVSSTRAAARYLKKNNYYFNNWIYALQAYQMGAGGVLRSVSDTQAGSAHMEISSKTYWYVKKFLAHKIAFEPYSKGPASMRLSVHENKIRRSVADWAAQFSVPEEEVRNYNRWVRGNSIPDDKTYAVIQAVANPDKEVYLASGSLPSGAAATPGLSATQAKTGSEVQRINGLVVIVAQSGDKATTLAERAGVELSVFLRNNDLSISDPIIPGQHYFLRKKHARASQSYHTVQASETLWSISQANGMQLKKLKKYNRIETDRDLKAGMTLWLTGMKPRNATQVTEQGPAIEVDATETFSWSPGTSAIAPVNTAAVSEVKPLPDSARTAQTKSLPVPADSVTHVQPDVRPREHIVQPGETLYGLSKLYNVPVMDLVNWNQLDLQVGIKPGQKLILEPEQPATSVGEIAPEVTGDTNDLFHEVKSSDTLYSIARKYGVTIKELMEWNNKQDFTLSVGEKLRIRKE